MGQPATITICKEAWTWRDATLTHKLRGTFVIICSYALVMVTTERLALAVNTSLWQCQGPNGLAYVQVVWLCGDCIDWWV